MVKSSEYVTEERRTPTKIFNVDKAKFEANLDYGGGVLEEASKEIPSQKDTGRMESKGTESRGGGAESRGAESRTSIRRPES